MTPTLYVSQDETLFIKQGVTTTRNGISVGDQWEREDGFMSNKAEKER